MACSIICSKLVLHLGEAATEKDGELVANLFGAVGKVWKMDEKLSDAAGAVGHGHENRKASRPAIASPGGTTIAGIHELEKGAFRASIMNAIVAANKRSHELGK
ncbi:Pyrroline-5-carboxylate reductase [Parasponia andersonii]|uniref:Pyrroline-5-carboxylate reductase n=1 Tax=Parasponia andersonii TaxID=3476 RepID=A0A2P5BU44_PARAD|nr:Pyrroline-5-carboxylate reductase [Parasponia andersonii]